MLHCSRTQPRAVFTMFTFHHSEMKLTGKFPLRPSTLGSVHIEDLKLCLHSSDLNGLCTQLGCAY